MRHSRLKLTATVEFPPEYKDTEGAVLSDFKAAVVDALRNIHAEKFGPLHWPVELSARAEWTVAE